MHSARAFLRILELSLSRNRYAKIFAEVGTCNLRPVGFGDWSRWNSEERRGENEMMETEGASARETEIEWNVYDWSMELRMEKSSIDFRFIGQQFHPVELFPRHSISLS